MGRAQCRAVSVIALTAVSRACVAQLVLNAHDSPWNLRASEPAAMFFDLQSLQTAVVVTAISTANDADPGQSFRFELLIRDGTGLGGSATSGPGSTLDGWLSLGTATGTQGPVGGGVSLPVEIPRFVIRPGHTTGVALYFRHDWGPNFYRTVSAPYWLYEDQNLRITTGDVRVLPFTLGQLFFSPCALVGSVTYELDACYPNCDSSTIAPVLNVNDFLCFMTWFASGDSYANCDQSTSPPILSVNDFVCFTTQFTAGCS